MTSKKLESKSEKEEAVSLVETSINDVLEIIETTYLAFLDDAEGMPSVILLGKPGVGKTVSVYSLAKRLADKLGREFIDLRTVAGRSKISDVFKEPERYFIFYGFSVTHVEPTDLSGVLRPREDYSIYLPPEYVKLLSLADIAGVIFLDEITTDTRVDRKSSEMKILDERQFGYITLSNKVMVITAGNTEEDTSLASPLPDPILRGRVMIFRVGSPTVDEWISFMNSSYGEKWDKRIGAFLKKWPGLLWKAYDSDEGYTPRNSPRSWTKLARTLFLVGNRFEYDLRLEELEAYVGRDKADEIRENVSVVKRKQTIERLVSSIIDSSSATLLLTFLNTNVPDLEDLRLSPEKWLELSLEAKYIVVAMLASREPEEITERFSELLNVISEDSETLELLRSLIDSRKRQHFIVLVRKRYPQVFKKLWNNFKSSLDFGLE